MPPNVDISPEERRLVLDSPEDRPPIFVRWTDYLTGRESILRISADDADLPLGRLLSKYLVSADTASLISNRNLLPESLPDLLAIQDLTLTLTDDGDAGNVVPGSIFRCGPRTLSRDRPANVLPAELGGAPVGLIDVSIDRSETGYARNWTGFNRRRWERDRARFSRFVEDAVRRRNPNDAERVLSLDTEAARTEFLRSVALAIWESPFENYSRFTGSKIRYKTGDETLVNIIDGGGAICSEKVQALKFVTDRYGFRSRYVFAGPDAAGRLPEAELRHLLESFDFQGGQAAMRHWQHMALEFTVAGTGILVDATNGNIPFLFMTGAELGDVLDRDAPRPVRVRMATYEEDFYYHRVPGDLALDLFYAMESYIPEIDLVQVFDNELGLAISPEFLVSPVPYRNEEEFESLVDVYSGLSRADDLRFEVDREWRLDGVLGQMFRSREPAAADRVLDSRDHLLARFEWFEGDGYHMGLAIVELRGPK